MGPGAVGRQPPTPFPLLLLLIISRIYFQPCHDALRTTDLFRKLAVEEEVKAESLQNGEECWLSNGVRGFLFGKITLQ